MEIDIFESEQKIYSSALKHLEDIHNGAALEFNDYEKLTKEYGKLLKQLRKLTRIADRTTSGLHKKNLDLNEKIHYDALTGIYNRRFMEDNLQCIIKGLSHSGGELSIMMLDVDFFKR